MVLQVRRASLDDVEAVRSIGLATWPTTYAFAGSDFIDHGLATWWSPEAVARSIRDNITHVCVDGAVAVGTSTLGLQPERAVLWTLYVKPEHQRTGAGRRLLAAALESAGRAGYSTVELSYVDGNEPARKFYAANGFGEFRREDGEPGWPQYVWLRWREALSNSIET